MKKEKSDQNAVAELTREGLYKENKWLCEENKKLKEEIKRLEFDVDARHQLKLLLEGEIEKLKEYNGELIENHKKDISILCEENKKLKSDLSECECSMHFENDEVGYRKRECKKLKEELSKLKEKYGDIDY